MTRSTFSLLSLICLRLLMVSLCAVGCNPAGDSDLGKETMSEFESDARWDSLRAYVARRGRVAFIQDQTLTLASLDGTHRITLNPQSLPGHLDKTVPLVSLTLFQVLVFGSLAGGYCPG